MPYINVDEAYILDNTGLQVDQVVDIPYADAGLTETQQAQARKNIAAGGTNPNLLDNPWFVGGGSQLGDGIFPINQRGQTSYGTTYGIDRWKCSGGTATLNTTGILISENFVQFIEEGRVISGKTYTISALFSDGTLWTATGTLTTNSGTTGWQIIAGADPNGVAARHYGSNKWQFQIWNNQNRNLVAAKLELGSVSTLANDAPPDYDKELEHCKHYFERIKATGTYSIFGTGVAVSTTAAAIIIPMTPKRTSSYTITTSGSFGIIGATSVSSLAKDNSASNSALVVAATGTGYTSGMCAVLRANNDNTAYIDVSADL